MNKMILCIAATWTLSACNSVFSDFGNTLGEALDSPNSEPTYGQMIFTIETSQDQEAYKLPLPSGYEYDFKVDWGDNVPAVQVTSYDDQKASHVYEKPGVYTITLSGKVEAFDQLAHPDEPCPIVEVENLGNVGWKSLETAFLGCANLTQVRGGDLSQVTSTRGMFYMASLAEPETADWDVSQVTNMEGMFAFAKKANPDTLNWNVSKVKNMSAMFMKTDEANPQTENWKTSKVTDVSWMFHGALSANPEVSDWDLSHVTDIQSIFNEAPLANPDVSQWDVSKVENLSGVFRMAVSATPDVRDWKVKKVTDMESLFGGARQANPDLSLWDFKNVTDMDNLVNLSSISSENYSKLLVRVAETTQQEDVVLRAGRVKYQSFAQSARVELVDRGWSVFDGGLAL